MIVKLQLTRRKFLIPACHRRLTIGCRTTYCRWINYFQLSVTSAFAGIVFRWAPCRDTNAFLCRETYPLGLPPARASNGAIDGPPTRSITRRVLWQNDIFRFRHSLSSKSNDGGSFAKSMGILSRANYYG